MPKYGEDVSESFCKAVKNAEVKDITYSKEQLSTHSDIDDTKTGFRPIKVSGIAIPATIRISYVEGCDSKGKYWYVISWADTEKGQPKEYESTSEDEARLTVLKELKRYIES